jgi:hypothetical protein
MKHLVIADDLVGPTDAGLKKNTIRAGFREIELGPLELRSASGLHPVLVVDVIEVGHKLARDVAQQEIAANGFNDLSDMLSGMRRFYPDFGPLSVVTIVTWR